MVFLSSITVVNSRTVHYATPRPRRSAWRAATHLVLRKIAMAASIDPTPLNTGVSSEAEAAAIQWRRTFRSFVYDDVEPLEPPPEPQQRFAACNLHKTFPVDDDTWTAQQMTAAVESWRLSLPTVPFYLYETLVGLNLSRRVHHLQQCLKGANMSLMTHYTFASWWFVRQLLAHPWRVEHPAAATLLVVPVFFAIETLMNGACGRESILTLRRMRQGALFRERPQDHLVLAPTITDYTPEALSLLTANSSIIWATSERATFQEHKLWQTMVKIVVPYPYNPSWMGVPSLMPSAAHFPADLSVSALLDARRELDFVFGGAVWPGLQHEVDGNRSHTCSSGALRKYTCRPGYAIRLSMCNGVARGSSRLASRDAKALCVSTSGVRETGEVMPDIRAQLPLPTCALSSLTNPQPGGLFCSARFSGKELLTRARFVMSPRGDSPMTARLYESVAFGTIPIFVSDRHYQVGAPFQAFVPYLRFALQLSEAAIHRDATGQLLGVLDRMSTRRERRMRELLLAARRDLLWSAPNSRVGENVLLEAARMRGKLPATALACFEEWSEVAQKQSPATRTTTPAVVVTPAATPACTPPDSIHAQQLGVCRCKCTLIDVGLNNGRSVREWARVAAEHSQMAAYPERRAQLRACVDDISTCYYGFEANPAFTPMLNELERQQRASGTSMRLFTETAFNTQGGDVEFLVEPEGAGATGSTLSSDKMQLNVTYTKTRVASMDAGLFLHGVMQASDFVAAKVDIEGLEYKLLTLRCWVQKAPLPSLLAAAPPLSPPLPRQKTSRTAWVALST